MNLLLDIFLTNGLLLDAAGIVGLGLLGFSAIRLSSRHQFWGGSLMAVGAIALLTGRLYMILAPHLVSDELFSAIGPLGIALTIGAPPLMLSFGLAGVVWGLWGHERQLNGALR